MSAVDRTVEPAVRPFGPLVMPELSEEILPNGAHFCHYSGGDQPVCRLSLHFDGGEREIGSAVGKLLMQQFSEGSALRSAEDIAEELDYNGARISACLHSHCSVLELNILTERLPQVLDILAELINKPRYFEERLEVSKNQLCSAIRTSRADAGTIADENLRPLVFGAGHPLATPLSEEKVVAVNVADLEEAHAKVFVAAGTKAYLSGSIDDDSISLVKKFLLSLPQTVSCGRSLCPGQPVEGPCVVEVPEPEGLQQAIAVAWPAVPRSHEDFIPLRLTVMALGGYFGSRLNTNIREEKGLTYGIYSWTLADLDNSYVCISAKCDKSYTAQVIEEIKAELSSLVNTPPTGEELERLRLTAITSLAEQLDTPSAVMSYHASHALVGTPNGYFEAQQEVIYNLSPEMMAEMARKYLDPDKMIVVVAGK